MVRDNFTHCLLDASCGVLRVFLDLRLGRIEANGTQQGRIEKVRAMRGCEQHKAYAGVESIKFGKQLVSVCVFASRQPLRQSRIR